MKYIFLFGVIKILLRVISILSKPKPIKFISWLIKIWLVDIKVGHNFCSEPSSHYIHVYEQATQKRYSRQCPLLLADTVWLWPLMTCSHHRWSFPKLKIEIGNNPYNVRRKVEGWLSVSVYFKPVLLQFFRLIIALIID